jgi:hypothetical protein
LILILELFMKNSKKNILFVTAFLIAVLGVFSTTFFIREIILGIKSSSDLKKEVGMSEVIDLSIDNARDNLASSKESIDTLGALFANKETLKDKFSKIENDLNLVRDTFEFVPMESEDPEKIVFSGKSTGKFSEVTRQLQIIENYIYPIEISKVSLVKTNKNSPDSWVLFFEAEFLTNEKYEQE